MKVRFVSEFPYLMEQWDFDKNAEFDVNKISAQSNEIVWWKCKDCGHEWQGKIVHKKKNKTGCPRCNGVKNKISILDVAPDIVKYYDYDYPNNPKLETLKPASRVIVHWKCPDCGNTWEQPLRHRYTRHGDEFTVRGCGFCNEKSVRLNYEEKYPELARMYSSKNEIPFKDLKLKDGAMELIWVCDKCGCEFSKRLDYMLNHTDNEYNGCPACSGKRIAGSTNNFAVLHPDLMKEYSPDNEIDPYKVMPGSNKTVKWICSEGHTWEASFQLRNDGYGKCPICNDIRTVKKGCNSLQDLFINKVKFFSKRNERNTDEVLADSRKKYIWICPECGGEFWERVVDFVEGKYNCPFCNNNRCLEGVNTLEITNPEIVKYWRDSRPINTVRADMLYEAKWACPECDGEFRCSIPDFLSNDYDCPYCANRKVLAGYNTLKDVYPELEKYWSEKNDRKYDEMLATFVNKAIWYCPDCGGEFSNSVRDFVEGKYDCPYCNDRKVLVGLNSLIDTHPELKQYWSKNNEQKFEDFRCDMTYPAKWQCPDCGGEYNESIKNFVSGNRDCPYCNDRRVLPNFNSFAVKHPDLMKEWDEVANYAFSDANEVGEKSTINAWWNCPKGHTYKMSYYRRMMFDYRGLEACPYCKGLNRKTTRTYRYSG